MVPTTGLEPINRVFSPLPTLASFSVFIAHKVTSTINLFKHYVCIFGKSWEEKRVQIVCKETGCANFVQTKLAPESVQTLCKDFGPPWRVAGLWRVRAITGGSWQRPGIQNAPAIVFAGGLGRGQARRESIQHRATQNPQQRLSVSRMHPRL